MLLVHTLFRGASEENRQSETNKTSNVAKQRFPHMHHILHPRARAGGAHDIRNQMVGRLKFFEATGTGSKFFALTLS